MYPKRDYNRRSEPINPEKTPNDQPWGPQAILALILVIFIGLKFLSTPGVDAKELLAILGPLATLATAYFFIRRRN